MNDTLVGVMVGSATTLLAGVIVPIVMELLRRRSDLNRARIQTIKALIPEILEVCAENVQRWAENELSPLSASSREVRLISQLEMVAAHRDEQVVKVLKMATTATRSLKGKLASHHLIAAMTVLSEWAETGRGDGLYATYDALVTHQGSS